MAIVKGMNGFMCIVSMATLAPANETTAINEGGFIKKGGRERAGSGRHAPWT